MNTYGIFALAIAMTGLAGCFGNTDLSCEEAGVYQLAAEGRRIDTPSDLSTLDPSKEIPLPEISPGGQGSSGLPCLERPPVIIGGS